MARLTGLDALRGIAALCVVAHHAMLQVAAESGLYLPVLQTINLGRFGVLLFFLISGFVIPPTIKSVPTFVINRIFRLLPALWLSVLCAVLIFLLDGQSFTAADVAANMTMLARPLGRTEMFSVYWTLSVELGFYAFCALLFAFGQICNWRIVGALALLSAVIGTASGDEMIAFPAYLLAGMIARAVFDGSHEAGPWLVCCFAVLALCGVLLAFSGQGDPLFKPLPKGLGMVLPLPVFLLAIFRPWTPHPALVWLGEISYSLYLFQLAVMWPSSPSGAAFPFIVAGLTIMIASLVHRFVEMPGIQLGRRLARLLALR